MQALDQTAAGARQAHDSARTSAEAATRKAKENADRIDKLVAERAEARQSAQEASAALEDAREQISDMKAETKEASRKAAEALALLEQLQQSEGAARSELQASKREVAGLQQRLRAEGIASAAREDKLEDELAALRLQLARSPKSTAPAGVSDAEPARSNSSSSDDTSSK